MIAEYYHRWAPKSVFLKLKPSTYANKDTKYNVLLAQLHATIHISSNRNMLCILEQKGKS